MLMVLVLGIVVLWVMFYGDDSVVGQVVGLVIMLAGIVLAFIMLGTGLGWI